MDAILNLQRLASLSVRFDAAFNSVASQILQLGEHEGLHDRGGSHDRRLNHRLPQSASGGTAAHACRSRSPPEPPAAPVPKHREWESRRLSGSGRSVLGGGPLFT
jgi:hypothetical protein